MKEQWDKLWKPGINSEGVEEIKNISMQLIRANPYQPRSSIDRQKIEELAQSIKTYGLLQPIILMKEDEHYCIIAGERRFLACEMLGWSEIPAIVRDYSGSSMAAVALIENLQREDLDFMEEARGYKRLMEEFKLTQEVLAQRLGKSQSTIANKLRLLKLPPEIIELLKEGRLSERHARALLKIRCSEKQKEAVSMIMDMDMKVKDAEKLIEEMHLITEEEEKERKAAPKRRKVVVRDLRILLNTVRQAVNIIRKAGLNPQVEELDRGDHWEVVIRLPKEDKNN